MSTFPVFLMDVTREFTSCDYTAALDRLKLINRYQWPSKIDAFIIAEAMWTDSAYTSEEIVYEWLMNVRVLSVS